MAAAMGAIFVIIAGCGGGDWKKPAAPEQAAQPAAPTRVKADVGVGTKGHDYGEGIVATPINTYFSQRNG